MNSITLNTDQIDRVIALTGKLGIEAPIKATSRYNYCIFNLNDAQLAQIEKRMKRYRNIVVVEVGRQ